MYKTDLVSKVAKETTLSQRVVLDVINESIQQISQALSRDEKVTLPGFGSFYTRQRPKSQARNFKTGKLIHVPAMRLAGFRVGELLKQAVRRRK